MAEPARKPDPVYGDNDEKPVTKPDLRAREGLNSSSTAGQPGGATSGTRAQDGGLYNSTDDSPSSLKDAEESPSDSAEDDNSGKGFYNPGKTSTTSRIRSRLRFRPTRRQAIIGGGMIAGVAGTGGLLFFLLLPLKIEHVVQNLENRFFATSKNAVSNETHILFTNYIKSQLGPAMKLGSSCSKHGNVVISRGCSVSVTGNTNNPVINLYKTWSQAKLETKLADNYGIEIRYNKSQHTYYLKAPGINGQAKIGDDAHGGINGDFDKVDRGTVRQALKSSEDGMTSWNKVMFRFKVGRLLEEKYGIKRCVISCSSPTQKYIDAFADKKDEKKIAAKVFLTQRVITPRTETLGIVLECLLDPSCSPEKTQPTTATDGSTGELGGAPENPEVDSKVRSKLTELAAGYGIVDSATVDKMLQNYKDISEKGYSQYVLKQALDKIGLAELSDKVADATPVIGWVNAASSLIANLNTLGPKVKKLGYITNAAGAVSLYMMYRSYADEIHTGHIDATELGSMTTALGPGNQGAPSDPEVGGTATAEATPLYNNLIGGGNSGSTATSIIDSLLPTKAYADSSASPSNYLCSSNHPVSTGQLVCPEEKLGQGNSTLDSIHSVLNAPGIGLITATASFIHGILGTITGIIGNLLGFIISNVPGLNSLSNLVNNALAPFFKDLVGLVIPNPFGTNMSGGRTFDMMAAGADVSGNDYAHTGLGGQAVSATAAAQVASEQETEAKQQFSHQPFFARMFSADSQYSLVSKLAMDVPFNAPSSAPSSFAAVVSNPFSALTQGFASIFSGQAAAGTVSGVVNGQDTFGVTQYQPQTVTDPLKYWNQHCSDNASQAYQNDNSWNNEAAATTDPTTGMPENTSANPCLLIKATTGAAGGALDTSNLSSDDLADINNGSGSGSTPGTTGGCTNPFPGGWTPGRLDMGYDGTFKGQIVAPCSGTITYAATSFSNWGGYIEIKFDQQPAGLPTSTLYFAEGVKAAAGISSGQHVNAGQPIADAYTTGAQAGIPGNIEFGVAQDGSGPSDTYAKTLVLGSSAARQMVLDFAKWTASLGVAPPSETSNAGSP